MKIGIIGSGNIGGTLAKLLVKAGHDVALSNSRGPDSLRTTTSKLGPKAHAMTKEDAVNYGDVIILAAHWRMVEALPTPEAVKGKIVIDAMNPYKADMRLYDLGDSSSSEEIQKHLPGTRLVKAFNTIYFEHLATQGNIKLPHGDRRAIPIAGDDIEAKKIVSKLIDDLGFGAVDMGALSAGGKRQEPGSNVYDKDLTVREVKALASAKG